MQPVFAKNLQILSSRLLEPEEIPVILPKSGLLRVESFGDVCNVIQAANYLRIAAANPWCRAAIWTKNPQYYLAAIKGEYAEKAGNTNLILSSVRVNEQDEIKSKYAELFDRIFTVYDNSGIKAKSININCGARSCASCKKCYKKDPTLFAINEKLK